MRLSKLIGLIARARARHMERPGKADDVDEVVALCTHMDCRYLCPSLLDRALCPN